VPIWSSQVEVHWGNLGQAYVTPVAEDEVCVAAITRRGGLSFDSVLGDIPHLKHRLQGAESLGRDRGAVTTTRKLRRVTLGDIALGPVALIGDASGSADAVTGEGLASTFREALLLGDALGRDRLADYEAGHHRILRMPQAMASLMLTMDRWPAWRDHALRTLAASPEIFAAMLGVHLGEVGIASFAANHALPLAARLLLPKPDPLASPEAATPWTAIRQP
jgi:flavin-dependent dehydrogenase